MASSMGFRILSFLPSCHSSYGAWTFTPVGLAPTDHASLRWTHRLPGPIQRQRQAHGLAEGLRCLCQRQRRAVVKPGPAPVMGLGANWTKPCDDKKYRGRRRYYQRPRTGENRVFQRVTGYLRVPRSSGVCLMPPSGFLRFWTSQAWIG